MYNNGFEFQRSCLFNQVPFPSFFIILINFFNFFRNLPIFCRETKNMILPIESSGLTLIHIAAFYDSTECLVFFLDNGYFIVDEKSSCDTHPLHFAICNSSLECISILLAKGADPNYVPAGSVSFSFCFSIKPNIVFLKFSFKIDYLII